MAAEKDHKTDLNSDEKKGKPALKKPEVSSSAEKGPIINLKKPSAGASKHKLRPPKDKSLPKNMDQDESDAIPGLRMIKSLEKSDITTNAKDISTRNAGQA